jgi:hypothetical protein
MRTLMTTTMLAAAALAGCVTMPAEPIAAAPTCMTDADCSVKWAAARTFVLSHAGYKIQTYSTDYLETYNSVDTSTDLAAQVNREPLPGGGYQITGRFWCANIFGCVPGARETLDGFNRYVASIGAPQAAAN